MIKQMKGKMFNKLPQSYKIKYPLFASIKYDGRYTQIDCDTLTFYTSGGKEYKHNLTQDEINFLKQFEGHILEAEFCKGDGKLGGRHQTGIQLTYVTDYKNSGYKHKIEDDYNYKIFRVIKKDTKEVFNPFNKTSLAETSFRCISKHLMNSIDNLFSYLYKVVSDGFEGIIAEELLEVYKEGKRVNSIIKLKQINEAKVRVIGVLEGTGKYKNKLGSFICSYKGKEFNVGSGLTDYDRCHIFEAIQYVGKEVEIEFESLVAGVPQQPIFKRFVGGE